MSWSGTVYCRYCGDKGHNSRTCPQKTAHYKQRAEAEVENGEGREGYWHRMYAQRTGMWLDGEAAPEMKKRRAGGTRRCKYCNKTGHNTRTCAELAQAKEQYLTDARRVREFVLREVRAMGAGIGSLFQQDEYGNAVAFMVQGHVWENVNHESFASGRTNFFSLKRLTGATTASRWERERNVNFPQIDPESLPEGITQTNYSHGLQMVGPVSGGVNPPDGWLELEDIDIKEVFKDRQSPNHYDNQWED